MSFRDKNANEHNWFAVELEGRLISSGVALVVFLLKQWLPLEVPVGLLVLSMSIDLIRAAWRNHVLEPSIVVHHLAAIIVSMTYLCLFRGIPQVDMGTSGLLGMEITNPLLHGAWIFAKHPLWKTHAQAKVIVRNCMLGAIFLWPFFRVVPSVHFAATLAQQAGFNPSILHISVLTVSALAYLQIVWFFKLVKLVLKSIGRDTDHE